MNSTFRFVFVYIFFAGLLACSGNGNLKQINMTGKAQGTSYSLKFYAEDSTVFTQNELDLLFRTLNQSMSLYEPGSLINQFNTSDTGVIMDNPMAIVVDAAMQISEKTKGLSDITVFPLVQFWGFGVEKITEEPDTTQIPGILECVGQELISVEGNRLIKKKPCVKIDLNGIAQGFTVDMIASMLESKGIENYIVEVGGEIRVKGRKQPGNKLMEIGIESPADFDAEELVIRRVIRPGEGAVTTSGNFHKYYESHGKVITHLINPYTGYSVNNELVSVTVLAKEAMTADGYDNALMAMGLKDGLEFAEKHDELEAYFIYRKPDGIIADTATTGFYELFNR